MKWSDVRTRRTSAALALAVVPLAVAAAAVGAAPPATAVEWGVTSMEPSSGPVEGGDLVAFLGSGFIPGHTMVQWDGALLEPASVTETRVEVIAPAGDAGPVAVRVLVAEGISPVLTYVYGSPAPEPEPTPTRTGTPTAEVPAVPAPTPNEPAPPRRGRPGEDRVPDGAPDAVPDLAPPTRLAETGGAHGALVPGTVLLVLGAVLAGGAARLRS